MRIRGAILALVVLTGVAAAQEPVAPVPQIAVTGEGRVTAVPDMATLSLGVAAEAPTAREAMDRTSERVAALLARLEAAGVAARDIQTSGVALGPVWSQPRDGNQAPRVSGFSASNTVTVRVREVEGLGALLDGALDAGANTLHGVGFGLQDPAPRLNEARAAAVADARAKAELIARAAGVELGPILSISEDAGVQGPAPMYRMEAAMASGVPVAAGETELTARVAIVWQIGK